MRPEAPGRVRVMGQSWATTTVSAHRVLKRLPRRNDRPLSEVQLNEEFREETPLLALEFLEDGGWVERVGRAPAAWRRTQAGEDHLRDIEAQHLQVDTELHNWLLRHSVAPAEVDAVRTALRDVVRNAFQQEMHVDILTSVPELLRILARLEAAAQLGKARSLLITAATEIEQGLVCPVASVVCREALGTIFQEFYESVPIETDLRQSLSIILDTNVLVNLLCPAADRHTRLVDILRSLAEGREVKLFVAPQTMAELRRLLRSGQSNVESMMISRAATGLDAGALARRRMGNPFVLQYACDVAGQISYSLYADREYLRIWERITSAGVRSKVRQAPPALFLQGAQDETLPVTIELLRAAQEADVGSPTRDESHAVPKWPSLKETRRWLGARKRRLVADHDACLCHLAIGLRARETDSYWLVWTSDSYLVEYERQELKLSDPRNRIFRTSHMMQALRADRLKLGVLGADAFEHLTAWAAAPTDALQRTEAALGLLKGTPGSSYEEYVRLLEYASRDPYGVLEKMRGEEEPIQELEERPEPAPDTVEGESLPSAQVVPAPGWPQDLTGANLPLPRALSDAASRLCQVLLPLGRGTYLELSGDWATYVAAHGPLPATLGHRTLLGPWPEKWNRYQELQLSVHSVAHFDLPWALVSVPEQLADHDRRPDPGSPEAAALRHSFTAPQERQAVVVDLRYKVHGLRNSVEQIPAGSGQWVLSGNAVAKLPSILQSLWIRKEELQTRLASAAGPVSLRDGWVVFHTGWPELFWPRWPDLSNPGFECWHAWNLHPYLDLDSANWLLDQGIYGLATDTAMLDCPAYVLPRVPAVAGSLGPATSFLDSCHSPAQDKPTLPGYQPTHVQILLNCCPMIESLSIPSDVLCRSVPAYEKAGRAVLTMFTAGLGMPQMMDAALAKVFLRVGDAR